jgi:glycosyltransferase involved in cell wall biosynthesis
VPSRLQLAPSSRQHDRGRVSGTDTAGVLALLALPPPVHGQSIVNKAIVMRLAAADRMRTHVVDIGPARLLRGPHYHLTRIVRVFGALIQELNHARVHHRTLYTVVDSGWGIIYNFITLGFARILRFRLVVHHHTAAHTLAVRPAFHRLARLIGRSGLHVALGPAMAADLKRLYPSVGNVIVVNNAFAVSDCREVGDRNAPSTQLRIGFLSNLSDEKGLNVVLDALRMARRSGLDLVLRLAGPVMTEEASARLELAKHEFGETLEVLGPVSEQAKNDFFNNTDIFLFPTSYKFEAQPLVVIEAMAHGCAIVTNARGYIVELVGDAATVVADDHDFVETVIKLCTVWSADRERLEHAQVLARGRFRELRQASENDLNRLIELIAPIGAPS